MIFINDQFLTDEEATISPQDRGFLLGDGIFTTLKYAEKKLQFFEAHYQRLSNSAKIFGLLIKHSCRQLEAACYQLITKNQLQNQSCALRISLSRGQGVRGLAIPLKNSSTLVITASPYHPQISAKRLQIATIQCHSSAPTSQHKTLNYFDRIMARQSALDAGFDDALILNQNKFCVGATAANLFVIRQKTLLTPALDCGVLAGIIRAEIINHAQHINLQVLETELSVNAILTADSVFLTNSLIGIQPVKQIEQQHFSESNEVLLSLQHSLIA